MYERLPPYRDDPIESTFRRCAADDRDVLNLSIGVFRDENNNAPILDCVRQAEQQVIATQNTKAYIGPTGNPAYAEAIAHLALGQDHPALAAGRVRTAQTPGAGAALRVAAELIRDLTPEATVWFSTPVWDHQVDFFTRAGLKVAFHPYYDWQQHRLDFPAMLDGLDQARPGDVLILHASCHNPTGEDPDLAQWQALTDLCQQRGLIPLIDMAYQGYGDGIDEDAAGLRLMAAQMPEMMVAISSSKSFAVYRDRVGALMLIHPEGGRKADELFLHLCDLIRALYFMPPDLGAAVITAILSSEELRDAWQAELASARRRVQSLRHATHAHLSRSLPGFDSVYMTRQKGMFSCLPIDEQQRRYLETDHAIYLMPSGRLNFAALSERNIPRLAEALKSFDLG